MKGLTFSLKSVIYIVLFNNVANKIEGCDHLFEGFGVFLGSAGHFSNSPEGVVQKVFEKVYTDLGIRYYRTSIESYFSPSPNVYNISCISDPSSSCKWIEIHKELSKPMYSNISIMASIWSPPHYMKDDHLHKLKIEQEQAYHYFITNITQLIKTQFNLTIERVSPINEPENVFAPWEHTNMPPNQLCRMVREFNDTLVSACPENSYYWVSEIYSKMNIKDKLTPKTPGLTDFNCAESCEIFATHGYTLNINLLSPDNFKAYYDLIPYDRLTDKPIWMTEVSSTFGNADENQMKEAFDLSTSIMNLVGHTCIQRYYYWYSYSQWSSGESLIWGDEKGNLTFPKKYHTYKHFTLASSPGPTNVTKCNPDFIGVSCIQFGKLGAVFVNNFNHEVEINWRSSAKCQNGTLTCTTDSADWESVKDDKLPSMSICSCKILQEEDSGSPSSGYRTGGIDSIKRCILILILIHLGINM